MKSKLIRITTVPVSMNIILKGQLNFMSQYYEVIGVTGFDEKHYNDITDREGIRMHKVEMARDISLARDFHAVIQLFKLFKKEKPEIVHTHTPKAGLLGMIAAKLAGVPIRLHTVGGMPQMELLGWKKKVLDFTERITYRFAHKVYPNSKGLEEFILKMNYCDKAKLKVLGNGSSNGVNTEFFNPELINDSGRKIKKIKNEIGIKDEDIVLLFVGRIAHDKGVDELINAFSKLILTGVKNVKLLFIGTYEKEYGIISERTKSEISQNSNIIYLGRFDDIRPYYLISHIFILPSYREGFPNAVLEAQSMGLPCVVTNINGCNEIIKDKYNGLVVPVKNSHKLYKAMLTLINDKELRMRLAANARPNIQKKYKREIIWHALLTEYSERLQMKHFEKPVE